MSKDKLFSFNTPAFPEYRLEVLSFKGHQEIGALYNYEIDLISKKEDIDFEAILQIEVSLQIHNTKGEDIFVHGVLEYFEAHQEIDDFIYYKARLVPKLWWLTLALHQELFLNQKVPDIIENILQEARFTSHDYELQLQGNYDVREYVCQYKESRYDFLTRWMYREGIYFYFKSSADGCKVIITDSKETQEKLPNMDTMLYSPDSGLQNYEDQAVRRLLYRSNNSVQSVRMKNYNYEKPSLDINVETDSSVDAYKESYLFGNNLKSQDEAKTLSEVNVQRYQCLEKEMQGESNISALSVGYIFTLQDYFRKDLNGEYLMLRVDVEASQREFFTTGFSKEGEEGSFYRNSFIMIPATTQYRMQSAAPWPHIGGMISATIDGAGSGMTAELDKHGRYKVIMPFDLSGRKDAKASAYLRMAQPSAGEKQGIHFPLHKGTEVLIAFKGGDPDQPIITGAVPNINTPSPVNENNVAQNVIQTHGGNVIKMEDTPGKAHIKMGIHDDLCTMVMHNDDGEEEGEGEYGIAWKTGGFWKVGSLDFSNTIGGIKEEFVVGAVTDIKLAEVLEVFGGWKQEIGLSDLFEAVKGTKRGAAPVSQHLAEEVGKVVVEKELVVVNNDNRVTKNVTEVIERRVDVTQEMIAEYVKNIVTGMNLIETLESRISTVESEKMTALQVFSLLEEAFEEIEEKFSKVDSAFVKAQDEIKMVNMVLNKSKLKISKQKVKETLTTLNNMSSELLLIE